MSYRNSPICGFSDSYITTYLLSTCSQANMNFKTLSLRNIGFQDNKGDIIMTLYDTNLDNTNLGVNISTKFIHATTLCTQK